MSAEHPPQGSFIPSPGQPLGYPDTKVIELRALMDALAKGETARPNIDDWVATARALDAVPVTPLDQDWRHRPGDRRVIST